MEMTADMTDMERGALEAISSSGSHEIFEHFS